MRRNVLAVLVAFATALGIVLAPAAPAMADPVEIDELTVWVDGPEPGCAALAPSGINVDGFKSYGRELGVVGVTCKYGNNGQPWYDEDNDRFLTPDDEFEWHSGYKLLFEIRLSDPTSYVFSEDGVIIKDGHSTEEDSGIVFEETTEVPRWDDDGCYLYVDACYCTATGEETVIDEVNLTVNGLPEYGKPIFKPELTPTDPDQPVTVEWLEGQKWEVWTEDGGFVPVSDEDQVFEEGKRYALFCDIRRTSTDYIFGEDAQPSVEGLKLSSWGTTPSRGILRCLLEWDPDGEISSSGLKSIADASVTLAKPSYTYRGKAIKPVVTVKLNGVTLVKDTDYTVAYKSNINVGTAKAIVSGTGAYEGSKTVTFRITKAANPIIVKAKTVKVRYAKLRKKSQTVAPLTVTKAQGAKTYTVKKWNTRKAKKHFSVAKKTGKVLVKKGTPKGTYKFTIAVRAAGNANYKAKTVAKTVKIVVK